MVWVTGCAAIYPYTRSHLLFGHKNKKGAQQREHATKKEGGSDQLCARVGVAGERGPRLVAEAPQHVRHRKRADSEPKYEHLGKPVGILYGCVCVCEKNQCAFSQQQAQCLVRTTNATQHTHLEATSATKLMYSFTKMATPITACRV